MVFCNPLVSVSNPVINVITTGTLKCLGIADLINFARITEAPLPDAPSVVAMIFTY